MSIAATALCTVAMGCSLPVPGAATPTVAEGECANDYFPVRQGATWSYTITGDAPGGLMRVITSVKADGFTTQDVLTPGSTRTTDWSCSDGIIALKPDALTNGLLQARDLITNLDTTDNSGVTAPDNLGPGATWNQDVSLEGSESLNGQDVPAKNHLTADCNVVGTEPVTVPAGRFVALRAECRTNQHVTLTLNGNDVSTDVTSVALIWYAQGVGIVKADEQAVGGPRSTIELTAYKIP